MIFLNMKSKFELETAQYEPVLFRRDASTSQLKGGHSLLNKCCGMSSSVTNLSSIDVGLSIASQLNPGAVLACNFPTKLLQLKSFAQYVVDISCM